MGTDCAGPSAGGDVEVTHFAGAVRGVEPAPRDGGDRVLAAGVLDPSIIVQCVFVTDVCPHSARPHRSLAA
jgi:hypothetical protein